MTGSPVLRKTGSLSVQCPETLMANFHPGVTMIRSSFALLFSIFMVFGACTLCGQELKGLVVVDIASCVDQYRKTASERERLEALSKEKSSPLEQERQDIEAMGGKLKTLDSRMNDTSFSKEQREEARSELERVFKEMRVKQEGLKKSVEKVQTEMVAAQDAMAEGILSEVRAVVQQIASEKSLGIVYDKSFLPKSNKAIVYISPRVIDLTDEVIKVLNSK